MGHAFLDTLPDAVFYLGKTLRYKLKRCASGKILDGKNRLENGLKPDILAFFQRNAHLQKPSIRIALHPDQVRDINNFSYFAKVFPYAFIDQGISRHDISKKIFIKG